MGTPAQGFQSFLQIGREAVFGTAVAATRRLGIIDDDPQPEIGVIRSRTINNSVSRLALYKAGQFWRYKCRVQVDYEGILLLWDALMGTATFGSVGGSDTGASPYVHTYIEKALLNSHTIEVIEGNMPAGQCLQLVGAKLEKMKLSCKAGLTDDAVVIAELDWVAKTANPNIAITGALTAATELPVIFGDAATWDDGSGDANSLIVMMDFTLEATNKITLKRFGMGDYNPKEFLRNDFMETMISIKKEFQSTAEITKLQAFTSGHPKLVFGSTTSKRLTFDIGTAYITKRQTPTRNLDIIEEDSTWTAVKDPTNASALLIKVENTESVTA